MSEFNMLDVLVYIGNDRRWVVCEKFGNTYLLRELYGNAVDSQYKYHVNEDECHANFVKVGTYTMELGEVDDE